MSRESPVAAGEVAPDADLMARWAGANDTAALAQLVRRHGGMVLGVCRRLLGTGADADDAFQTTFLIFVRKGRSLAHPERVAAWLHAVALQVARKARAVRARRRQREAPVQDVPAPLPPEDTSDLRRVIDEELDRLPEKYRVVIVLCELEGRTLEEAARLLGWPRGTVAGRLSRGRDLLRRRLTRRDRGLPLFLILLPPAAPEALVERTLDAAGGDPAPQALALAEAVLRQAARRRLSKLLTLLLAVGLLGGLAWQLTRTAFASEPVPSTPAPPCCCHGHADP